MKAQLRELRSLEIEERLGYFWPKNESNFGTWVRLVIGPENEVGSEYFDIFVCTPAWIGAECAAGKGVWGRNLLVIPEYDIDVIKSEVNKCIDACIGETWAAVAMGIAKFSAWEYEGYRNGHNA